MVNNSTNINKMNNLFWPQIKRSWHMVLEI